MGYINVTISAVILYCVQFYEQLPLGETGLKSMWNSFVLFLTTLHEIYNYHHKKFN